MTSIYMHNNLTKCLVVEKQLWEICFISTLWPIERGVGEGVVWREEWRFPGEMKGMCVGTRWVRADGARAGLQLPQGVKWLPRFATRSLPTRPTGKAGVRWRGRAAGGRAGRPLVAAAQPFLSDLEEFNWAKENPALTRPSPTLQEAV